MIQDGTDDEGLIPMPVDIMLEASEADVANNIPCGSATMS
jgi:hypothetical protein